VTQFLIWVRALELSTRVARGDSEAAPGITDWLVETARAGGLTDVTVEVLAAAAAARLAAGAPQQARALLGELEQTSGAREVPYYARQLAAMLRTALAAGDPELAERLAEGLEPLFAVREHALCAARAQLAEAAGDHAEAALLYAEAAERWREFGNLPELGYALLGGGRCLLALGRAGAEVPLAEARELFASLGYKPAHAETEALLIQSEPAPL